MKEYVGGSMVTVEGAEKPIQEAWSEVIALSLQGLTWNAIAVKLQVPKHVLNNWVRDIRFRAMQSATMEYLYSRLAHDHVAYVDTAFKSLSEMAANVEGDYSEKIQLEAASRLIELVHGNINIIKILEQNRLVVEDYLDEKYSTISIDANR